jgi:hypothetical protein
MTESLLKCQIFKGMFSDELAINVNSLAGEVSVFVPKELVHGEAGAPGTVRVRVFRDDFHAWAVLPNDSQTAVAVNESDLLAA